MAKKRIPEPPESTPKLIRQPPLFYRDGRALSEQERYPRPAVAAPTDARPAPPAPAQPHASKVAEAARPAAPNLVADRNRHPAPRLIQQPPLFYRNGRQLPEHERYNLPAPPPQPPPARPGPPPRNTSGDWLLKLVPPLLAIGYVTFMVMMSALTVVTALAVAMVFRLGRR